MHNRKKKREEFKGTSRETLERIIDSHQMKPMVIGCGAEGSFLLDLFRHSSNIPMQRAYIASRANQIREPEISYLLSEKSLKGLRQNPKDLMEERLNKKDIDIIIDIAGDNNIIILLGSLMDGDGTYLLPLVADALKGSGKTLLAFVTGSDIVDLEEENNYFNEGISLCGSKELKVISVNINSVDHLKLPAVSIYRMVLRRLVSLIEYLVRTENEIGLVNLDIHDAEAVFSKSQRFFFNSLGGRLSDKPADILDLLLKDTIVDLDIKKVNRALCDIRSGDQFTVGAAQYYAEAVSERFPDIETIWGASVEKDWGDKIELSLILSYSI